MQNTKRVRDHGEGRVIQGPYILVRKTTPIEVEVEVEDSQIIRGAFQGRLLPTRAIDRDYGNLHVVEVTGPPLLPPAPESEPAAVAPLLVGEPAQPHQLLAPARQLLKAA